MPSEAGGAGPSALRSSEWRFPADLLAALRAAVPAGSVLRLGLWNGEAVALSRVVSELPSGVLGEVDGATAPDARGPVLVAVPWQAIARVDALPPKHRMPPGFAPPSAAPGAGGG